METTNGGVDFNISSHWYGADGIEYAHADQHIQNLTHQTIYYMQEMMVDYTKLKTTVKTGPILVMAYK